MVEIIRDYKTSTPLSYGNGNSKTEIVIHETGNTRIGTTARNHHNLQMNGNSREASWHYQVDDKEAIQSFGESLKLWHSGTHANNNAISIEICVNRDGNYNKAVKNAIDLAVDIAKRNNITLDNINTHHSYTGKNCPQIMLSNTTKWNWSKFKNAINKKLKGKVSKPKKNKKSINQMANLLIGKRINGHTQRRKYLGVSRSTYKKVRKEVNRIMSGGKSKPTRTIKAMANEVINKRINGHTKRRKYLGVNRSTYKKVRKEVNRIMSGSKSKPARTIKSMANTIVNKRINGHTNRRKYLGVSRSTYRKVRKEVNRLMR